MSALAAAEISEAEGSALAAAEISVAAEGSSQAESEDCVSPAQLRHNPETELRQTAEGARQRGATEVASSIAWCG